MLDTLRKPLFIVALCFIGLAVIIELGAAGLLREASINYPDLPTPGFGIPYLALLDGVVLFTVGLMAISLLVPERVHGRVQGIATLLFSLLLLIGSIALIMIAIALLMLMVSLLLAIPFGTLVYLGVYGDFDVDSARATLAMLMTLKLGFAVCLVFAHQRFLENKGLIFLILCSLLGNIIVSFLQGLVPGFLVSITDDIAAIIVAIIALIWAIIFLIGSIPAIIKALRVDRALA